jgi:hypothetical protein
MMPAVTVIATWADRPALQPGLTIGGEAALSAHSTDRSSHVLFSSPDDRDCRRAKSTIWNDLIQCRAV